MKKKKERQTQASSTGRERGLRPGGLGDDGRGRRSAAQK